MSPSDDDAVVSHWHVGMPSDSVAADVGVVGFTARDLSAASSRSALVVLFHEAMRTPGPRSQSVDVHVPTYRGKSFLDPLAWLASRLAQPTAIVSWHLNRQQGPDSIRKLLDQRGWPTTKQRQGSTVRLSGPPASGVTYPQPRTFTAKVGNSQVTLAADYGVFSPDRVDAGTELLLDVALRVPPVEQVADIGVGYGPLAIGLVRNAVAQSVVATDVDCVALWLAALNARANDVQIDLKCSQDPTSVEPTALTVCNIPTHINSDETARFMTGLAARARLGRLLVVVHASLRERYVRHLEAAGLRPAAHPGPSHVVLDTGAR